MADSLDELPLLFDDPDNAVREQAARAMHSLDEVPEADLDAFIRSFVNSASFESEMEHLMIGLKGTSSRLPIVAIDVYERAVEIADEDLGGVRTARAAVGNDLVTLVLRLYRQGDRELRSRCLDVIDRLCELGVYGVGPALDDER